MQEHPNAALVRQMQSLLEQGDWTALDNLMADDIVWHEIGRAEPRRGKQEMAPPPGEAESEYEIKYDMHDVVANDDHTVLLGTATATRNGKTLVYKTAEIFHVRDGKITERWAFSDDTERIVDFFA
ncbi:MAG: nuclear transport factor 2 family protein [Chloroflexota bacterium]